MFTVGYIPLDDRPCNLNFPYYFPKGEYSLIEIDKSILGNIKSPANLDKLDDFIISNAPKMDYLVVSLDTLIYGGLIPSRLHFKKEEELCSRLEVIKKIRQINPNIKIFAFITIMRCPNTNFDSEEPTYFSKYGKKIFEYGRLTHLSKLESTTKENISRLEALKKEIPSEIIKDFTSRRATNLKVVKRVIDEYKKGLFDYFIIPQDDSAPYGFTSMDQNEVRNYLKENKLINKVLIYPGADEVGMNLIARCYSDYKKISPKIYVYYSSCKGPFVIPSFEDRMIDLTINSQILVSGSLRVYSFSEADIVLLINIGGKMLYMPSEEERIIPYDIERNLPEMMNYIKYTKKEGKIAAIGDVAIPTGADFELLKLMQKENLLLEVDAYASWNTSSNTIGTVIASSVIYFFGKDEKSNKEFLIHRYYDDVGYCSYTRGWCDVNAALARGYTEAVLDGVSGTCTKMTRVELLRYMSEEYPEVAKFVKDVEVTSPWNRSFEMDFKITYR